MDQNQTIRPEDASSDQVPERTARSGGQIALSVLRVIGKILAWLLLILFTLCVIGVLTAGIFGKIFMTYIDTTLIPSLGEISYEEMSMSLASTIYAGRRGQLGPCPVPLRQWRGDRRRQPGADRIRGRAQAPYRRSGRH